jgi:hypothetical protein
MSNAMMSIKIYRHCETWAFTDPSRGLQDEPFVCGIPEIIDFFIEKFSDPAKETHRIIFSAKNFPLSHGRLEKNEMEYGGAWYSCENGSKGWLCPATLKFFDEHPEELYVRFE